MAFLLTLSTYAQNNRDSLVRSDGSVVYYSKEKMAEFVGGAKALQKYLKKNTHYPSQMKKQKIMGTVYVLFFVEKDGTVVDVSLVKGIENGEILNEEALRVVREMPKWDFATLNGIPVRQRFTLPIKFNLR